MPHLARLAARGAFMPIASTVPFATFPAWATCVTGVNPGRHGLFDFTEMVPGEYALRFTNATYRRAPALWNILSSAGKRVVALGVPATWPPEKVNGVMVAGFDSPVATAIDASFVYPPELYPEVRGWKFADFQESRIGPGWHARALPRLLAGIAGKEAIALKILRREPWDFFMTVFGESDTVSHHFWMFHDPKSPRHRPGPAHAIREVYERLDTTVGALISAAGEDTIVGVVSDHGFGGTGTGVLHLNNWLAEHGLLRFAANQESFLKKAGLRLVPQRWRGALFRRLGGLAARAEGQSRFAGFDWTATRAWSEELSYFPSVRVNLRGREPQGQVAPEDYGPFVRDLCAELENWAPVAKAWPREDLYSGPYMDRAPDIVLELAYENGYAYSCLRARGGPGFRRIAPQEFMGGKERGMNGSHRPEGVLFLSETCPVAHARLEDIAPTVLAALDVPSPPMDGRPLWGATESAPPLGVQRGVLPYTEEEAREVENRLRVLGYLE